ncbi:hypothetical protein Tco_0174886 [Tanacetum coccineum]
MADKKTESTMKEFTTNDHEDYYSGIKCITVNGKNAYELKGKFLHDLHKNAFSKTHGEDAVKHIEYFLKFVNPIDLPYVNQDKLSVVVFPISLAGDAWKWFDGIKGSITRSDEIEPTDDESFDLEETNHNDEQEIREIFRIETTLFNYETPVCEKFKEFNYLLKIDPDLLTKDIEGFKTYEEYKDDWIYEWKKTYLRWTRNLGLTQEYGKNQNQSNILASLSTIKLDVRNGQHIVGGMMDSVMEETYLKLTLLETRSITKIMNDHEADEREVLCEIHELPVCNMRRFEMIKYSFGQDKEYVAVKEDEYDDLERTSNDARRAYQEIF